VPRKRQEEHHRQRPEHRSPYLTGHEKRAKITAANDPPAIVQCPHCMESVLATRGGYWDMAATVTLNGEEHSMLWIKHVHQPSKYSQKLDQTIGDGRRRKSKDLQ